MFKHVQATLDLTADQRLLIKFSLMCPCQIPNRNLYHGFKLASVQVGNDHEPHGRVNTSGPVSEKVTRHR